MNWEEIRGQYRKLTARTMAALGDAAGSGVPYGPRKEKVLIGKTQARFGALVDDAGRRIEGWTRWPSHRVSRKANNQKVE
jgi:hypothetical protein